MRFQIFLIFICLMLFFGGSVSSAEKLVIYTRAPVSEKDSRQNFVTEIITAAMDHTVDSFGPYERRELPRMSWRRMLNPRTMEAYPNLVIRVSGCDRGISSRLRHIPIPINRGIVGFRLLLISSALQEKFSTISNLSTLRDSGLVAGQGRWLDADILRENDLPVVVGSSYEGLFPMLAAGRFDYLPRGVNEVFSELEGRKTKLPGIQVEEKIALYYPLPRVLATSKDNTALAERLKKGLELIFQNGIHQKIWLKYNREAIKKAQLDRRKIIHINNPFVFDDIPVNRKEYWYLPGDSL